MITVSITHCYNTSYHKLLEFLATISKEFYLVNLFRLTHGQSPIVVALKPHLLRQEQQDPWPGTQLGGSSGVPVLYYEFNRDTLNIIKDNTDGLFDWTRWREKPLPEDIGFLRKNGELLLGSTSHEQFAWLNLTEREYKTFVKLANIHDIGYELES